LILQNYLKRGIEPSPELLDSLDPTNISYDGTLSSHGSSDSLRISAASNERRKLVKKQHRRQSILPSFFEPLASKPKLTTASIGAPVALTTAALTAHDHPAVAFLGDQSRVIRRSISFAGPMPTPPIIRIIKPEPECLDDHSNPSSRDPFYYDKVLNDIQDQHPLTPPRRQRRRINSKVNRQDFDPNLVEPDTVTSWFADQYLHSN